MINFLAVHALALFIAVKEGFYKPNSLPARLHNPGSLVYARQRAAVPGDRGFARFRRDEDGWAALERDLMKKMIRGTPLHIAWAYLP